VDTLEQLQNNIESVNNKNITVSILDSINRVNTNFQELLNPSNW